MRKRKLKKKVKIVFIFLFFLFFIIIPLIVFHLSEINLILNGDEQITIGLNDDYNEPGIKGNILFFKVKDIKTDNNIDNSKIGSYKVIYTAKFLYKTASKERIVNVIDNEIPQIELLGETNIKLYTGLNYKEEGWKATDNIDGDITDKVKIVDNVNYQKAGKYKIIYEVSDSNNNKTSAYREIEIMARPTKNVSSVPVLMYHFFYDKKESDHSNDGNWMEISNFEEQIKYLADNNYYFPSWQEIIDYLDKKITLPEKSIVITVDDSDETFFKYAVPIIQKYNVTATTFVIGYYFNTPMTPIDNIYYGSHTYNMHRGGCNTGHGGILNCINYNDGINDLKRSIEIIGDNKVIAYPFGDVNANAKKIVKDAGFQLGFTTVGGKIRPGMNKLELPRVRVSGGLTLEKFIERI